MTVLLSSVSLLSLSKNLDGVVVEEAAANEEDFSRVCKVGKDTEDEDRFAEPCCCTCLEKRSSAPLMLELRLSQYASSKGAYSAIINAGSAKHRSVVTSETEFELEFDDFDKSPPPFPEPRERPNS